MAMQARFSGVLLLTITANNSTREQTDTLKLRKTYVATCNNTEMDSIIMSLITKWMYKMYLGSLKKIVFLKKTSTNVPLI